MIISFDMILLSILLPWTFLYTMSYGVWTWKQENRLGAIMVFIIAIAVIALPLYTILFIE